MSVINWVLDERWVEIETVYDRLISTRSVSVEPENRKSCNFTLVIMDGVSRRHPYTSQSVC